MKQGVGTYTIFNKLSSFFLLLLLSTALVHQRDAHHILCGLTFTEKGFLGKKYAHIPGNFFVYMTSENQSKPVPL